MLSLERQHRPAGPPVVVALERLKSAWDALRHVPEVSRTSRVKRSTPAGVTEGASRGEEFRAVPCPFRSRARAGNGSPVDEFVAVLAYAKEEL
jgi:hypothetical protein